MPLTIRALEAGDAEAVARLAAEFAGYLRDLGDTGEHNLTAGAIRRDGFGASPAFAGLVAAQDGAVIGYLLYHLGYDADRAARTLHVIDLYVSSAARRQGAGRALMAEAARICRQAGGAYLFWAVYIPNPLATAFYTALGAQYVQDLDFMAIDAKSAFR
jgi:ribosomal protein S18 acetylase RimI-like enzyme